MLNIRFLQVSGLGEINYQIHKLYCKLKRKLYMIKWNIAVKRAKKVLKPGDRVYARGGCRNMTTYTFAGWDGCWLYSISGRDDIVVTSITKVNGKKVKF